MNICRVCKKFTHKVKCDNCQRFPIPDETRDPMILPTTQKELIMKIQSILKP